MRALRKNKQKIFYALVSDESIPQYDIDENPTGEYAYESAEPVELWVNVSAARGESATRAFGEVEQYDKTICTTDTGLPITETTKMWIDQHDTAKPHDYEVVLIARSLNSVIYAVRKVRVS